MPNWNIIMENYESNDCESLSEYAREHLNDLLVYFLEFENEQQACHDIILCALYFLNIDHFVDGGEEDVFKWAFKLFDPSINVMVMQKTFQANGYARRVEQLMGKAPRYVREVFARLGCSLCSAKGYISDEERRVILSWV